MKRGIFMQDQVVKLYNERMLMTGLMDDTFSLIAKAGNVGPVKKLIEIHDILNTNASLLQRFGGSELTFDEVWLDAAALKHLNYLRCSLMVYHHTEFTCGPQDLIGYNRAFCRFLNLVVLRLKNSFGDFDMPRIS
jgi:hypothetical protein